VDQNTATPQAITCPFCAERSFVASSGGRCPRCGAPLSWPGAAPGSIRLTVPHTLSGLLTAEDLAGVGLILRTPRQEARSRGRDEATVLIAEGVRHGAIVTLELAEETDRPDEILSNFTDELNENHPVVLAGGDEAYLCLDRQNVDAVEAAIVARRGPFIFRLTIPANPRAADQLALLASLILQRYAADGVATTADRQIVCRYCARPFVPTANSPDCPYCGAASGTGAPTLVSIGGHDSIRLGSLGQMAQSLTLDDLRSVGLTPGLRQPRVYDDPDAITVIRVFDLHPWDGSTRIGFAVYDAAAHPNNRLNMVVRRLPGRSEPTTLPGSETAFLVDGKQARSICVERGRLIFCITVPHSPDATAQLCRLAALILERVDSDSEGGQCQPRVA
jgi:hypothetical protein